MEPDPPLVPRQKDLNKKCKLHVKIIDATFLKDGDTFGKQDPYIKWKYGRGEFQTTVKDDAGLYARWDESFCLNGIIRNVDQMLELEAWEKDLASSDFLGKMKPISLKELTDFTGLKRHDVELFDKKEKTGSIRFSTMLEWIEYIPPVPSEKLDKKSMLRIVIKSAVFLKDADLIGK